MAKKPKLGERRCPRCKEVIRADAEICKHCHTTFTPEEVAAAKLAARKEWMGAGAGCLSLLALLLVGSCVWTMISDVPAEPGPAAKADMIAIFHSTTEIVRPCDVSGARLAEAFNSGNAVAAYRAAEATEQACLPIATDLSGIDIPASLGKEYHQQVKQGIEACSDGAVARWSAARSIKDALDGNNVTSNLAGIEKSAEQISAGMTACVANLVGVAIQLGATQKDLGLANDAP